MPIDAECLLASRGANLIFTVESLHVRKTEGPKEGANGPGEKGGEGLGLEPRESELGEDLPRSYR